MPPTRRGRGRGLGAPGLPGELRGALGTLLRSTLAQASTLRDAIERGAREGRARLDDVRLERRRTDALADLGAMIVERVRRGELPEVADDPELADAIVAIEELEAAGAAEARRPAEPVTPARRERFDARGRAAGPDDLDDDAPWQSVRARLGDDGTVSSASWRPAAPAAPPSKGPARVWRPVPPPDAASGDDAAAGDDASADRADRADRAEAVRREPARAAAPPIPEPPAPPRPRPPRKGGIVFAEPPDPAGDGSDPDEDDLAAYMHPDDVPPRDRGGT